MRVFIRIERRRVFTRFLYGWLFHLTGKAGNEYNWVFAQLAMRVFTRIGGKRVFTRVLYSLQLSISALSWIANFASKLLTLKCLGCLKPHS